MASDIIARALGAKSNAKIDSISNGDALLGKEIKTNTIAPSDLILTTGDLKTIVLGTSTYEDIIINASNLRVGSTPPSFIPFQDSIYALSFSNNATDILYGSFEVPHSYKVNTPLEVHLHWSPSSTNTGNCNWIMKYSMAQMGGDVFGTEQTITFSQAGSGVINKHQYVSGNVTISGTINIGTIVVFALSRPTGDSFTADAFLHSIGVHYEQDTLGSRQRSIK